MIKIYYLIERYYMLNDHLIKFFIMNYFEEINMFNFNLIHLNLIKLMPYFHYIDIFIIHNINFFNFFNL